MATTVVPLSRLAAGIPLILSIVCLLLAPALHANVSSTAANPQQTRFLAAEKALQSGDRETYVALRKQLDSYVLAPYLDYADLKARLRQAGHDEVRDFLEQNRGTPVADLLRRRWLNTLAEQGHWKSYLAFYTPQSSITRQCHQLRALIETGQAEQALAKVEAIWLHGESRPKACDPVFAAWEKAGKRSKALTWQRIELAMEAGERRLARYLGKRLGKTDREWLEHWIEVYKNPRAVLHQQAFSKPHPYRETLLAHALRRMAQFDGMQAVSLWQQVKDLYPFTPQQRYQVERRIALAVERVPGKAAHDFILQLTPGAEDERLYTARLRAALLRQDWKQLLADLPRWPAEQRSSERWQYWSARASEASGDHASAAKTYAALSKKRSYYGFLAADRAGRPYHLAHNDTPADATVLRSIAGTPGIRRAFELHSLGRDLSARREWHYATRDLDSQRLKAAAKLAEDAAWHDQAIFTLARTGFWDDLELRFPLRHQDLVEQQAKQYKLDSAWIFAVIRQESAFMRDARSHAGAMGLMQLMPATAKHVAQDYLGGKPPRRSALLEADTNIALGSAYLRQLLDRLEGNPVLATAAYNAGPHRVDKWLPQATLDADIWVDLVPFNETRGYLRRVLYYSVIYEKRLGKSPTRLSERMGAIGAAGSKVAGA